MGYRMHTVLNINKYVSLMKYKYNSFNKKLQNELKTIAFYKRSVFPKMFENIVSHKCLNKYVLLQNICSESEFFNHSANHFS